MLISVIVPIYNAEKYLKRCLDSIINQKYKDLEIILIDDGSTDSSIQICNEYKLLDNRIKLISMKNQGVSCARNKGIDLANGEYIAFVDSDDTIDEKFINEMYNACVKNDAELSIVNVNYHYGNKIKRPINMKSGIIGKDDYYRILLDNVKGFVANKLYNKSLLKNIRFNEEIFIGEDLLFNIEIANNLKKVVVLNEYLYDYFQNECTAYNSKYNEKKISEIYAYDKIIKIINQNCKENLINYKCEYLKMAINQKNQYKQSDLRNEKINDFINKSVNKYYDDVMRSKEVRLIKKVYIVCLDKCYNFIKILKYIKNRVI